jgi:hypothetical protein
MYLPPWLHEDAEGPPQVADVIPLTGRMTEVQVGTNVPRK